MNKPAQLARSWIASEAIPSEDARFIGHRIHLIAAPDRREAERLCLEGGMTLLGEAGVVSDGAEFGHQVFKTGG